MVDYFLSTSVRAIYVNCQPFTTQVEANLNTDAHRLDDIYKFFRKQKRLPDTIPTVFKFICWIGLAWRFTADIVYQLAFLNKSDAEVELVIPERLRPRLLGLTSQYKGAYFVMMEAKYSSQLGTSILMAKVYLLAFVVFFIMAASLIPKIIVTIRKMKRWRIQ
jgi:hypothetical protein